MTVGRIVLNPPGQLRVGGTLVLPEGDDYRFGAAFVAPRHRIRKIEESGAVGCASRSSAARAGPDGQSATPNVLAGWAGGETRLETPVRRGGYRAGWSRSGAGLLAARAGSGRSMKATTATPAAKSGHVGMTPRNSSVEPADQSPQNQMNAINLRRFMHGASSGAVGTGIGRSYPRVPAYSTISGYPSSAPS